MTDRLLRISKVIEMTGKSRSSIYADIANGCFPNSILIGARSVAWAESAITAWIKSKLDASKNKTTPLKTSIKEAVSFTENPSFPKYDLGEI